jgi:hypothetical protein
LATIDFLANGGDDMKDFINVVYTPRNLTTIGDLKTVMKPVLQSRGTITQAMVLDPLNPRLEFV